MKLIDLTEDEVSKFSGGTIFSRGYSYYQDDHVHELDYDETADRIVAGVYGNYGDYEVEITAEAGEINADCDCPYDGCPCKHVVAVLLQLIHNKEMYIHQAVQQQRNTSSLIDKISALSKSELVEIVVSCLNKYPDFQRDLTLRLAPDDELTLGTILKQVEEAFPSIQSRNYSLHAIARQLNTILKSTSDASAAVRVKVDWEIANRTLEELNAYGIDDESLEEVAIDAMNRLSESLVDNPKLRDEKHSIIEALMDYYIRGNCGLVDSIYEAAHSLCSEKSDYQILIQKLEGHVSKSLSRSYYQSLLSRLYEEVGDADSQLRVLESNLEYGMDYWRLAQYWIERGDKAKALQIVHAGIDKGQGRKIELYAFVQEQLQSSADAEAIFDLFLRKVKNNDLDNHWGFTNDSTYRYLSDYYTAQNDYGGRVKLLELRFTGGRVDLDFYKAAEETLAPTDWPGFEKRIIAHLKKAIKDAAAKSPWQQRPSQETEILAEIYAHKKDLEPLAEIARGDVALLAKYESRLLAHYPDTYLEQYRRQIERLIGARGRDNYKRAAGYAKTVKKIYRTHLKTPDTWDKYIGDLRRKNKRLRALQEEFAAL